MANNSSVCFLRGINVSGKNMIKMADLVKVFTSVGFKNVSTYLQSGNVIFSHENSLEGTVAAETISSAIKKSLGLDVPAIIRSAAEIDSILRGNIFINRDKTDIEKIYVTMLGKDADSDRLSNLVKADYLPERLNHSGNEIYIFCPDGYGRAKLNNNFIEKKLAVTATTRNWKTMLAVSGMLK
jgi:uncharacterized protein (DUF1697 family)